MPGIIRRIWRACRLRALGVMSAVATLALATAGAQAAYPERAITLIVPFAAGGPTDIVARIVSLAFQKSLGQSVVVENRGGAAGNIGMTIAARAAPDGYTLLLSSTAIAVNPALFKNLGYDPIKDFAPVTASALSWPSLMRASAAANATEPTCTVPSSTAIAAGAAPR